MAEMKKCKVCKAYIKKGAHKCRYCGGRQGFGCLGQMVVLILILVAALILFGSISSIKPDQRVSNNSKERLNEQIALVINMRGYLCAEVVAVRPLKLADTYEVICIEYRGGAGEKNYIFNAQENIVFEQ